MSHICSVEVHHKYSFGKVAYLEFPVDMTAEFAPIREARERAKREAAHLSGFYGADFYVEVWVRSVDDNQDYWRAYVYSRGKLVAYMGF